YINEADYLDVSPDDEYAPYIGFATYHGIVEGYPDNTFGPYEVINRAEAARISTNMWKGWLVGVQPRYNELGEVHANLVASGQIQGPEYPDVNWSDLNCANEMNLDPPYSDDCWFYHPAYALRSFDGAACGKDINNQVIYDPGTSVSRAETAKIACIVSGVCDPEACAY
ncbi:MAG: S-layer homology domain-containing protein, partial [Verrucomicrobiae bacterium]|nr:S-layer homology domain-containing protein [Verrucomicrobiae bacterium]